ncbi:MAG TPA: helix-turn-helix transcriptional regulator [Gemmatimonadaceae bacterium]
MTAIDATAHATPSRRRAVRHVNTIDGPELKRRREALPCTCGEHEHMTQKELGELLGPPGKPIPLATISRWELGGTIEHPGTLARAMTQLESEFAQKKRARVARRRA